MPASMRWDEDVVVADPDCEFFGMGLGHAAEHLFDVSVAGTKNGHGEIHLRQLGRDGFHQIETFL